jgi:hypothetical protein
MTKRARNKSHSKSFSGNQNKKLIMEGSSKNNGHKNDDDIGDISLMAFDNTQLNSTEKFDAELKTRCEPLDQAIKNLTTNKNPSIKDISDALVVLLTSQKEALAEQNSLKKQLFSMTSKTIENAMAIKNMQRDFAADVLNLTAKQNKFEQSRIDDEVAVGGFPSKPDSESATKQLCQILNVPISSVYRAYSYEFKNKKTQKNEGQLVIKFNCKTDHINFNKAKREADPVHVSQLMVDASAECVSAPVKIFNRLTPNNRSIIASLRKLQKEEKILKDGIRYRNCCFEIKTDATSDFQPVPSTDHLNIIFK